MNKKVQSSVKFSLKEQTLVAQRLSFLIKAGIPILESLRVVRKQLRNKAKGKVFDAIIADVENGKLLANSISRFPRAFNNFAVNLIRTGELSGTLSENLTYLAEELKKKQLLNKKIIGALIYPIIITFATVGITTVLIAYIFPKILPVFKSLRVTLPLSTRIVISSSAFLGQYGLHVLLGLILFVVGFVFLYKKNARFRSTIEEVVLKLPLVGKMTVSYQMASFSRTLGLLLKSNVKIIEAISITADTLSNSLYRNALKKVADQVARGESISRQLINKTRIFPEVSNHMIAIGETTGKLSETFMYLAEMHEHEVDDMTKNLSSSIEPILMIVMGVAVGFIAISVITPIYEITQNLH